MSNEKRINNYSNADGGYNSYDGVFSSLSMGFFNSIAKLVLAPINSEFINKTPKKGDKVYDYENEISLYFSCGIAHQILVAIQQLQQNDYKSVKVNIGNVGEGIKKSIELFAPGKTLKVRGKSVTFDGYSLKIVTIDNDEKIVGWHVLQNATINAVDADGEEIEIEIPQGLLMLERFLQEVVNMASGSYRQGTLLANGNKKSGASSEKKKSRFSIEEEDDDSDEDDEDEISSKKAAKKKISEISKEFDDEDDDE